MLSQIVLIKKLLLHRLDIPVKQKIEHCHLCDIFKHDRIVYSVDCVLAPCKRSVRVYVYGGAASDVYKRQAADSFGCHLVGAGYSTVEIVAVRCAECGYIQSALCECSAPL